MNGTAPAGLTNINLIFVNLTGVNLMDVKLIAVKLMAVKLMIQQYASVVKGKPKNAKPEGCPSGFGVHAFKFRYC
jgi:uncharacterized protein YjbI with pentapeptide repeats